MCWSWEIELGYYRKRISWGLLILLQIMCFGEHKFGETVLGDTVDTAPLGIFLHKILI